MAARGMGVGARVFGAGVILLGAIGLVWGDFVAGQPVPRHFPARTALAYAAAALLVLAGAALQSQRTVLRGAAVLTAYYLFVVLLLMNGRLLLQHHGQYMMYSSAAEQVGITAAALILFAIATREMGLVRVGQVAFGVCALLFGGAHFVYMHLTAPLVPRWLPPSQVFWGYLTGVAFLAAGLALITGVRARLAAILVTVMLACFGVLVNAPILFAGPRSRGNWSESAVNLALTGAAWVVAESLA